MTELAPQATCRLSGEPLDDARVLIDLPACPVPGIYPERAEESVELLVPLRVVQARGSGFVQLAHRFDDSVYADYGFAAATSTAYQAHLEWFAGAIADAFAPDAAVLEVGCGDGTLLSLLEQRGFGDRIGIDPGRAAAGSGRADVVSGYFPGDLPAAHRERDFDLIVLRHVLEHIEQPAAFVAALAARLAPGGELWIEVPDLDATLETGLWSNFYPLHCNSSAAPPLDRAAADAGRACVGGELVDVFGGSLLRRYRHGAVGAPPAPEPLHGIAERFDAFRDALRTLAETAPDDAAGYGAAERTAVSLGAAPELAARLDAIYDGNRLL